MDTGRIHVLALSHQNLPLEAIGRFHMDATGLREAGTRLRGTCDVEECFFLTTCNRAELVLVAAPGRKPSIAGLLGAWRPGMDVRELDSTARSARLYAGDEAVEHLMRVASSLESLVVGEREILAQVRDQYQHCKVLGLTGDGLRLLMRQVVVTAKRVYTETGIASRPVSVVSLAYRALKEHGVRKDARFIVVGAGKTCADMCRYLHKHGFKDLHIFNRTLARAEALVNEVGGEAYPLDTLVAFDGGFDVIISGIGRGSAIVDRALFSALARGDRRPRVLVDLALPHDIDPDCMGDTPAHLIRIEDLQARAEENKAGRQQEMGACAAIITEGVHEHRSMAGERHVERTMSSVPEEVKAIRQRAVGEVFARELARLDPEARAVLDMVLDHMERKYISGPMRTAKEIMLRHHRAEA